MTRDWGTGEDGEGNQGCGGRFEVMRVVRVMWEG